MPAQPVEIVNLRLVVTGKRRAVTHERAALARGKLSHALQEKRKVWFPDGGYVVTPIYERGRLPAGTVHRDLSPAAIRHEVEQSLIRLNAGRIDLYITHGQDPTTPIAETVAALKGL